MFTKRIRKRVREVGTIKPSDRGSHTHKLGGTLIETSKVFVEYLPDTLSGVLEHLSFSIHLSVIIGYPDTNY